MNQVTKGVWDILQGISNSSGMTPRFAADNDLAVLRESNVVSCIVEAGYSNNPKDHAVLMQPVNQEKIFSGIAKYFVK